MKKIYIQSLTILLALLISSFSYAQKTKSQTQELKGIAKSFITAEAIKKVEDNLIKALGAERNRGAVTTAMKKFWKSAKGMNKQQVGTLFQRFSNASKTSLKKLVRLSPSQLSSYARDITSKINIDAKTLKQIISGTGNKAGNTTLKIVSELDDLIAKTGKAPKALLKLMQDEASGLDPKQAKAFYTLLKKKLSTDWADIKNLKNTKDGLGKYVGTVVDGVFVLNDAYDIYYSDDEPEVKAIKATSKIVDYGISTGAGAATTALGAGELALSSSLGVGLVIAFTANRVSTLYTEIMMLQKEREAAKDAVKNERIDNAILVRRQLVNISNKIKSGQIRNANSLLIKLDKFILNNNIDNQDKIYELHSELEEKAKKAERNELINNVINKARHPYQKALKLYKKGIELHIAKIYAAEALTILNNNLKKYPEIGGLTAISKTQKLITAINKKIDNAADFVIIGVAAPKKVYVNQSIDFPVFVNGGIPYYRAIGAISGNISNNAEVTMYWEAPANPGIVTFAITISDCMGSIASASVSIEVVEGIGEDEEVELNTDTPSIEDIHVNFYISNLIKSMKYNNGWTESTDAIYDDVSIYNISIKGNVISGYSNYKVHPDYEISDTKEAKLIMIVDDLDNPTIIESFSFTLIKTEYPKKAIHTTFFEGKNISLKHQENAIGGNDGKDMPWYITDGNIFKKAKSFKHNVVNGYRPTRFNTDQGSRGYFEFTFSYKDEY